eukprot:SM000063S20066  [mRNA]  locus=s63:702429:702918:+ [translate_table: standard]
MYVKKARRCSGPKKVVSATSLAATKRVEPGRSARRQRTKASRPSYQRWPAGPTKPAPKRLVLKTRTMSSRRLSSCRRYTAEWRRPWRWRARRSMASSTLCAMQSPAAQSNVLEIICQKQ